MERTNRFPGATIWPLEYEVSLLTTTQRATWPLAGSTFWTGRKNLLFVRHCSSSCDLLRNFSTSIWNPTAVGHIWKFPQAPFSCVPRGHLIISWRYSVCAQEINNRFCINGFWRKFVLRIFFLPLCVSFLFPFRSFIFSLLLCLLSSLILIEQSHSCQFYQFSHVICWHILVFSVISWWNLPLVTFVR